MDTRPAPTAHGARFAAGIFWIWLCSAGSRLDTAGAEIGRRNGEMAIFCGACCATLTLRPLQVKEF
jgi:hypothetical protein